MSMQFAAVKRLNKSVWIIDTSMQCFWIGMLNLLLFQCCKCTQISVLRKKKRYCVERQLSEVIFWQLM